MPEPLFLQGPCLVCSQPANGRHFGVMSCRACAAFFRRAAVWSFKARNRVCPNGNCKIFQDEKYRCKPCRLKKCHDVGMDTRKFQSNRDPLSSSGYLKIGPPQSLANFLGRPELILCCEPDKASHVKTLIDVSFLIQKAEKIFTGESTQSFIPFQFNNTLEQLTRHSENLKSKKPNFQKFQVITKVGKQESLLFWELSFLAAAKWFSGFEEFMELEMDVKLEILKSSWMLFQRLKRLAESAEFHRQKLLRNEEFICADGAVMSFDKIEVDWKWCTSYSSDQMRQFLSPKIDQNWKNPVDTLIELEPSNIELNFMLIQLCLHEAGKKFQGRILDATESLMQIQSNNLHDYYTKTLRMPNYSGRLTKLMKVNQAIQADVRERKERAHIAKVFDLFSIEYSHPEMFEIS